MELIRGGLRGRPVLGIDPDIGPLVSKRFTAGDLLLTCVRSNNVNAQSHSHHMKINKEDNWKYKSWLNMAAWRYKLPLIFNCTCLHCTPCKPFAIIWVCVCVILYPSRNRDAVIFHHLSFYWFVYKNSQTCCPQALLLPLFISLQFGTSTAVSLSAEKLITSLRRLSPL